MRTELLRGVNRNISIPTRREKQVNRILNLRELMRVLLLAASLAATSHSALAQEQPSAQAPGAQEQTPRTNDIFLHPPKENTYEAGELLNSFATDRKTVKGISVHPTKPEIAVAGNNGVQVMWTDKGVTDQTDLRAILAKHPTTVRYTSQGLLQVTDGDTMTVYSGSPKQGFLEEVAKYKGNLATISPDGEFLAQCKRDPRHHLTIDYRGETKQRVRLPQDLEVSSLTFGPDSRMLAVASRQSGSIRIVDRKKLGTILCNINSTAERVAFSAVDDALFATVAGDENTVSIYNVPDEEMKVPGGNLLSTFSTRRSATQPNTREILGPVVFVPGGIITASHFHTIGERPERFIGGELRCWTTKGELLWSEHIEVEVMEMVLRDNKLVLGGLTHSGIRFSEYDRLVRRALSQKLTFGQ